MAPRGQTLPQAATESAREARKSFFCELCQKGYARMNDFEAHEGSYDHQHRKRLKEMKQLTKDPLAASKAREAERRANEEAGLKSINLSTSTSATGGTGAATGTGGKKKPVFKSTLQPQNTTVATASSPLSLAAAVPTQQPQPHDSPASGADAAAEDDWMKEYDADPTQMVANGWKDQAYDVRFATICPQCGGLCQGHGGVFDRREGLEKWRERVGGEVEAWVGRLGRVEGSYDGV